MSDNSPDIAEPVTAEDTEVPKFNATWYRSNYRSTYRHQLPYIPGWNVSRLSTTGHMVSGDSGNLRHPRVRLMDLAIAMSLLYDRRERAVNPSFAHMDVEALLMVLELFWEVVVQALANGQLVDIKSPRTKKSRGIRFGLFCPVYQPYYEKRTFQGFKRGGKNQVLIDSEKEIIENWGNVAFIPDLPVNFGEELGKMYREELPAHGRSLLMGWTLKQRRGLRKAINYQKNRSREIRHAKRQQSAEMHKGVW